MEKVNVVSFLVYKNGKFLVEKRKMTEKDDPGKIVIPAGHVKPVKHLKKHASGN